MDYSELPEELIEKIARDHLDAYPRLFAFSRVCKSWRSTALRLHRRRQSCLPGLLVPKRVESQPPLHSYYNSDLIHEFYPLATISPAAAAADRPPSPRATLSFFPAPTKLSDALGQRNRYLDLYRNAVDEFEPPPPPYYDDDDDDNDDDEDRSSLWYDDNWFSRINTYSSARCLGSKNGWILRTLPGGHHPQLELYLLNPFTGASVPLPPLQGSISKAIISSSPDDDDEECHVFIVPRWGGRVKWCKEGARGGSGQCRGGWGFVGDDIDSSFVDYPEDAVCFGGNLYVVEYYGRVLVFDITSATPSRSFTFSDAMYEVTMWKFCHLCELNGQLLVVISEDRLESILPRVFKLQGGGGLGDVDDDGGGGDGGAASYYWEEVRSLDGYGVFIGPHESFSVPSCADGVKGDHIYYALDHARPHAWPLEYWFNWNGVFDLVNQKFESFALGRRNDGRICSETHPSFWFLPMTWDISKLHDRHIEKKKAWKRERLLPGSEHWKLPKRAIRNPQHPADHNIARTNRFQALLSDEEDDDVEED